MYMKLFYHYSLFTIIQLNRSIVHDIEHFISEEHNFMVCLNTYVTMHPY